VGAQNDLYSISADGTGLVPLATSTDSEFFAGVTSGGRVIFHRTVGAQFDLYSINADGTGLATLADTSDDEELASGGIF
jgi:hypothetical protein